jgi:hypothetical protein
MLPIADATTRPTQAAWHGGLTGDLAHYTPSDTLVSDPRPENRTAFQPRATTLTA